MNIRHILILSLAVRLFLVLAGGQKFFPDEARYDLAHDFLKSGINALMDNPAHPGYLIVVFPLLLAHMAAASLLKLPFDTLYWIPALGHAVVSVGVIALVYGISRRLSGATYQALCAACLAAASTVLLYFSRHLVPYDWALAFTLLAIWLSLDVHRTWYKSLAAGSCLTFAFLVYFGAIVSVGVALGLASWFLRGSWRAIVSLGLGAALPAIGMLLVLQESPGYAKALQRFSGSVTQGWFADAAVVPWAYLWDAEHLLLLILFAGLLLSFLTSARTFAWAATAIFCGLAIAGAGTKTWVVYGRIARTIMPFLCIAAAAGWCSLPQSKRKTWRYVFVASLGIIAAFNLAPVMTQSFPREIAAELRRSYPDMDLTQSVGPCSRAGIAPPRRQIVLLNAGFLWPIECRLLEPAGRVLFRTPHPFQYAPYAYESYGSHERALLATTDISIRLVQLAEGDFVLKETGLHLKQCDFLNHPLEAKSDFLAITSVPGENPGLIYTVGGTPVNKMDFIFTHANARLHYRLPAGQYRFLDFGMGLDDTGGMDRGAVAYVVKGDGKELFRSKTILAMQPPVFTSVSIEGVRDLELLAVAAADGLYNDEAYWLAPKLR